MHSSVFTNSLRLPCIGVSKVFNSSSTTAFHLAPPNMALQRTCQLDTCFAKTKSKASAKLPGR